jgi:hypothetical protein
LVANTGAKRGGTNRKQHAPDLEKQNIRLFGPLARLAMLSTGRQNESRVAKYARCDYFRLTPDCFFAL